MTQNQQTTEQQLEQINQILEGTDHIPENIQVAIKQIEQQCKQEDKTWHM